MESLEFYLLVGDLVYPSLPTRVCKQIRYLIIHQITTSKVRMCFSDRDNQGTKASSLSSPVLLSTYTAPKSQV